MNRKRKRPTVHSFLNIEVQLGDSNLSEGEKDICERVLDDSDYAKRFVVLFKRRTHSSMDFIAYANERNAFLARFALRLAVQQKRNLEKNRRQRCQPKRDRDMQMAREFLRRRKTSHLSNSALKAEIGRANSLRRSASIDGINSGLKLLTEADSTGEKPLTR
jgi:type IV secretory pathway TraG/TraD family ATPase VirD4